VTGLRREEVATLAGVSSDYYAKMERGTLAGVSPEVLDAVARALQFDEAETEHLHDLARAAGPVPPAPL
jgi:transcriptional regulator with XRE-family HTH domain